MERRDEKMEQTKVSLLGCTGSIGAQTVKVVEKSPDVQLVALAANRDVDGVEHLARKYNVKIAALYDEAAALELRTRLKDTDIRVEGGMDGLIAAACEESAQVVLNAVGGMIGLTPTIRAIEAGKTIALANKETLVCAGEYVMALAREKGVAILPVDSEHSAIFQCLKNEEKRAVKSLILTASGGPFFGATREEMKMVTQKDALRHPNWAMGAKITIDSATLMNKGLELIEAVHLFGVRADQVQIVVHRESIIHSMVEFCDNAVIAQLSAPNMELPIQYALHYPERQAACVAPLDFFALDKLTFFRPDEETFGCLALAKWVAKEGGSLGAVLNGANEAAVALFLENKISFLEIEKLVENAVLAHTNIQSPSLAQIFDCDSWAREQVLSRVSG